VSNEPADSFARRVEAHLALLDKLGTPAPRWGYLLANAFVDPSWADAMDAQAGAIARIVDAVVDLKIQDALAREKHHYAGR
jgi:hypothetical protein